MKVVEHNTNKPRGFARALHPDRIVGAKDSGGEHMFLMKWKDCDELELVHARYANIRCPQIVIAFYEKILTFRVDDDDDYETMDTNEAAKWRKKYDVNGAKQNTHAYKVPGFDRALHPDRIVAATDSGGELMFLMKWKDSDEEDELVYAQEANIRCPHLVIAFYEENLTWVPCANNEGDEENKQPLQQ